MRTCLQRLLVLLCSLSVLFLQHDTATSAPADSTRNLVYHFKIDRQIAQPAWRVTQQAVQEAHALKADYLLVEINTYGGMVNMADSIRTKLLRARPVTIAFINNNAASAGALISIACDSIYMAPAASIGAATVVDQSGQQMPDKYQSYMRSTMRATAEAQSRDPRIAEAMVDDRIEIEGVIEAGKVLTFTTSEAIRHGYCEGEANNIEEVLRHAGITSYDITHFSYSMLDKIILFFLNPMVNGLLLMIMLGGLYFEIQSPGVGFPGLAALTAAILYFAPLYLEGLAQHWEVLLFLLGVGLLALEFFVIPGFGIAGISGLSILLLGLILSLVRNDFFDFSYVPAMDIMEAILRVMVPILVTIILLFIFGGSLLNSPMFKRLILQDTESSTAGYTAAGTNYRYLVGKEAITATRLNPSGKIEVDDIRYDAAAEYEYLDKGEPVIVTDVRGHYLIVDRPRQTKG